MEREKHLKGYYKSYIERWQQKKKPIQVKLLPSETDDQRKAKLLKDHPEIKEKYSVLLKKKEQPIREPKSANERKNKPKISSKISSPKKVAENIDSAQKDSEKQPHSRRVFQTSYQQLYEQCLGEKDRRSSLERKAKELLDSKTFSTENDGNDQANDNDEKDRSIEQKSILSRPQSQLTSTDGNKTQSVIVFDPEE